MKNNLSFVISVIVTVGAVLVMLGWIFDISILKSILPQFVTMKFLTALCFLLSSMLLFVAVNAMKSNQDLDDLIVLFISFLILLIMDSLLVSIFLGITTGLENIFVVEPPGAIASTLPGRPAFVTIINFVLIGLSGLIIFSKIRSLLKIVNFFAIIITFSGSIALLGYIVNIPELYFNIGGISSAMAIHTAFFFVLLGVGFWSMKKNNLQDK